jgi:GNAT superfamily N-acetyltransferase
MSEVTSETHRELRWRAMEERDLDAVAAIAAASFPEHFESPHIFANRLAVFREGCSSLMTAEGEVMGYLISYPWEEASVPALNIPLDGIPQDAGLFYLHDLALRLEAQGFGYASEIIDRLTLYAQARGWPSLALVAVNDAARFWQRHGFEVVETPELRARLKTYGPGAYYMLRKL